ncbi:UDP-glycosyltransferase [Polaribacter sargassicola]|uniref:UDP-glycosyltransferase n=1 Tax=Polaribacter sargassicola TaxID=2836891 RepID=UPI001F3CFA68|nr:UDP-glycosyltransferase [Polaribacter sp. DS7-9]MCG1036606.1 UDP-glycosyltransferase [Polaribacter sp. DS7-9]
MANKKILFLLPDGGGLRNFVYSDFYKKLEKKEVEVSYWNGSFFPINKKLSYKEIKIEKATTHSLTSVFSRARKRIELNLFTDKFKDDVYQMYKFPLTYNNLGNTIKSVMVNTLELLCSNKKGLNFIKNKIVKLEKSTQRYTDCKSQLEAYKPNLVLCSNQRNTQALAPLLAAKDLGIKTACFIQSWDNVPKAMLVLETDYYFVWSDLMKKELLKYYSFISDNEVIVTGTPQFEPHYDNSLIESRIDFCKRYGLDINKKYICYSGDDETTSPLDQYYLEDLTNAVRSLNNKGNNIGIIFRRCPVDFSNRFDDIINKNKDIIVPLDPIWKEYGNAMKARYPENEDYKLLSNICHHSEMVTNVCSSTVFDFVIHKKPCVYYNYEQPQLKKGIRDIGQNYDYVHFRSMPSKEAVIFCDSKESLEKIVENTLLNKVSNVKRGTEWYHIIVGNEPTKSTENFVNSLSQII